MERMEKKKDKIIDAYYQFKDIRQIAEEVGVTYEYVCTVIRDIAPRCYSKTYYTVDGLKKVIDDLQIGKQIIFDNTFVDHHTNKLVRLQCTETVEAIYPHLVYMKSGRTYSYFDIARALGVEPVAEKINHAYRLNG